MNIQQALQQASQALAASKENAALDAQVMLCFVLNCNSAHLAAWPEKQLTAEQANQFLALVAQRQQGIPVAHLTGQREFWSLNFRVNNSTLIPRPETETLVEFILDNFGDRPSVKLLDMGTGTGAIAIAIASEKNNWKIVACDNSAEAIALAIENGAQHSTNNVSLVQSDWFSNISEHDFDIIVSNPPYIASDDPHLQQGDVRFEPHSALTAGISGMDDIEHICAHAKDYLSAQGSLIIEHGYDQQQQVADCFARHGYTDLQQSNDLSGHTRMTAGKIVRK